LLSPLLLLLRLLSPLLLLRLLSPLLLLRLLSPLLLLRLLSPLLLLRFLGPLLLRLLSPLLLLRFLGPLLLRGWRRALLLPALLLFSLALFLILLVALRICRDHRPEKQKHHSGTGSSNALHSNHPPLRSLLGTHAVDQSASTTFYHLCGLRLGPSLVHRPIRVVGRRVERIQLQRHRLRRIDHVMVRACRNHDRISVPHRALLLLVEDEFGLPLFDPEKLVDVRVHLVTDFFPRSQAHHYKLGVLSGE